MLSVERSDRERFFATLNKASSVKYNLVLVHTPGLQGRRDFEIIAAKISEIDDTINVFIAENRQSNDAINRQINALPTMIFSPINLEKFAPVRGTTFQGRAVDKLTQYRRFLELGILTPKTALLARNTTYSPGEWGEKLVLKALAPQRQSRGDAYLIATRRLNRDLLIGSMLNRYDVRGGVIVQQFINPGPLLEYHRMLALFGEPLYVLRTTLRDPVDLDLSAHPNETLHIANQAYGGGEKQHAFVDGEGFREISRACYAAFPNRALQAIDVLRCQETDRLFVLEANLGGNTWHFSSTHAAQRVKDTRKLKKLTKKKIRQFGAFDVAARVLAERTRTEAS